MKKSVVFLVALSIFLSFGVSFAQYGSFGISNAHNAGMGGAYAGSFSTASLGINPAYLLFPVDTSGALYLQFPSFSGRFIEAVMSPDDFNKYFGRKEPLELSDKQRDDFFAAFIDNPQINYNVASTLFAIAWASGKSLGAFAFAISDNFGGRIVLPRDLIDFAIYGNKENSVYDFKDLSFKSSWLRSYSLSYARALRGLRKNSFLKYLVGGLSVKYYSGFAYVNLESSDISLSTGEYNKIDGTINYQIKTAFSPDLGVKYDFEKEEPNDNPGLFMSPCGGGIGFDIGFAGELKNGVKFGLAFTDLGSINWSTKVAEHIGQGDVSVTDLTDKKQRNDLENFFQDSSYSIGSFNAPLPTAMRLSVSKEFKSLLPGSLLLALEYDQGFNDEPGNSKSPRIAVGARWKTFPYLPVVYVGASNDVVGSLRVAFGLGFSTSSFDFAVSSRDILSVVGASSKPYFSASANFIWKIKY